MQGFNARDMFNKSAAIQATIFFVLLILPGIVYGGVNWHTTSQRTHCVVRAHLCCLCTIVGSALRRLCRALLKEAGW